MGYAAVRCRRTAAARASEYASTFHPRARRAATVAACRSRAATPDAHVSIIRGVLMSVGNHGNQIGGRGRCQWTPKVTRAFPDLGIRSNHSVRAERRRLHHGTTRFKKDAVRDGCAATCGIPLALKADSHAWSPLWRPTSIHLTRRGPRPRLSCTGEKGCLRRDVTYRARGEKTSGTENVITPFSRMSVHVTSL